MSLEQDKVRCCMWPIAGGYSCYDEVYQQETGPGRGAAFAHAAALLRFHTDARSLCSWNICASAKNRGLSSTQPTSTCGGQ